MKHIVIFTLVYFIFFSVQSQDNSGVITYKVKANDEVFEQNLKKKNLSKAGEGGPKSWYQKQKKALLSLKYTMNFNDNESLFSGQKLMENDNGINIEVTEQVIGTSGNFYINPKKELILNEIKYLDHKWLVKYPVDLIEWQIAKETKEILGYSCYKALADQHPARKRSGKIVAWFAPELPLQIGPASYSGLPGIILEVSQGPYTLYATDITLFKKENNIEQPTEGKLLSLQNYLREKKELEGKMKRLYIQHQEH